MIIRIVKMTFEENLIQDFLDIFEETKHRIREFEGCLHLELLRDIDSENVFFTYSHWDSKEHLNNYRNSEVFGDVWPKTKVLFKAKPEAWSMEQKHILA